MSTAATSARPTVGAYDASTGPGAQAAPAPRERQRLASLDIVRGLVMVLMAVDHVRVYSGLPPGGPTPGIFFTRWITHFVAPCFVFLAGSAAYLHGERVGNKAQLSRFLLTRGLWLVALELTVIRLGWTFNTDYAHYLLAGVIWMIGWCMVLMAGLVRLPLAVVGTLGVLIIAGHNLMDLAAPAIGPAAQASSLAWLWQILYYGGPIQLGAGGPTLMVLFVIVPWIGVMAAGYAFGPVMRMAPERRRRICLSLGIGAIAAFLVLRSLDGYGDPSKWNRPQASAGGAGPASRTAGAPPSNAGVRPAPGAAATAPPPATNAPAARPARPRMAAPLRFLATSKYPASLLFLLMTLGPMLLLLPFLERTRGPVSRALETFGRVPFFYYLLHIPTIHLAAIIVSLIRAGRVDPWLFANHPMMNPPAPPGYTWGLGLLYLVWAIVVIALYFPSRWYASLKDRRKDVTLLGYL